MTDTYQADAATFTKHVVGQIEAATRLRALCENRADLNAPIPDVQDSDGFTVRALAAEVDLPFLSDDTYGDLLERLDDGEWGYGITKLTGVRVTLAGGGPAGWIDFTVDADNALVRAEVFYCDWFQHPVGTVLSEQAAEDAARVYRLDVLVGDY